MKKLFILLLFIPLVLSSQQSPEVKIYKAYYQYNTYALNDSLMEGDAYASYAVMLDSISADLKLHPEKRLRLFGYQGKDEKKMRLSYVRMIKLRKEFMSRGIDKVRCLIFNRHKNIPADLQKEIEATPDASWESLKEKNRVVEIRVVTYASERW